MILCFVVLHLLVADQELGQVSLDTSTSAVVVVVAAVVGDGAGSDDASLDIVTYRSEVGHAGSAGQLDTSVHKKLLSVEILKTGGEWSRC